MANIDPLSIAFAFIAGMMLGYMLGTPDLCTSHNPPVHSAPLDPLPKMGQ